MASEQAGEIGEAHRIQLELDLVMSAIGCSVRKTITRYQHEQACAAGVSYSAVHEQHEENMLALELSLRDALATMQEMSAKIQQALEK
jgi:hypothetical protein